MPSWERFIASRSYWVGLKSNRPNFNFRRYFQLGSTNRSKAKLINGGLVISIKDTYQYNLGVKKLTVLLLPILALVNGCSSGMSLENETKLAEYSACLNGKTEVYLQTGMLPAQAWESAVEFCAKYKP